MNILENYNWAFLHKFTHTHVCRHVKSNFGWNLENFSITFVCQQWKPLSLLFPFMIKSLPCLTYVCTISKQILFIWKFENAFALPLASDVYVCICEWIYVFWNIVQLMIQLWSVHCLPMDKMFIVIIIIKRMKSVCMCRVCLKNFDPFRYIWMLSHATPRHTHITMKWNSNEFMPRWHIKHIFIEKIEKKERQKERKKE